MTELSLSVNYSFNKVHTTYFEDFAVSIEHIHGDLNVLLDTLASSLKVSSLQREVKVVAYVT